MISHWVTALNAESATRRDHVAAEHAERAACRPPRRASVGPARAGRGSRPPEGVAVAQEVERQQDGQEQDDRRAPARLDDSGRRSCATTPDAERLDQR